MSQDELEAAALQEASKADSDKKASSPDAAVSRDAELKAIEKALSERIMGRLSGQYGWTPYAPFAYPTATLPLDV